MRTKCRSRKGSWMKLTSASAFKGLVQEKGISYERLARYADCHKSFIEALCNGRKSTCTEELADEIARALGVNTELIFVRNASANGRRYDRPRRTVRVQVPA